MPPARPVKGKWRWAGLVSGLLLVAAGATGWYRLRPIDASVTVDRSERFQRLADWEATAWALSNDPEVFKTFRSDLFELAIGDLGISRLRLEVRSGAENTHDYYADLRAGRIDEATWRAKRYATVNDNGDPSSIDWNGFHFSELDQTVTSLVQPMRERAARDGQTLRVNVCYVAFTGQITDGGAYQHDDPREYGEFIEAVWRHLRETYGWVPDGLEVMLEPDNARQWNGTLMGRAIVDVATRLKAAGFAVPHFIGPSTTNMANAITYFDDMVRVEGVAPLLTEVSYHRYHGASAATLAAIQERASRYQLGTAMLELIGADQNTLHEDLTVGWNTSWAQFTLAGAPSDNGSKYYIVDIPQSDHPRVSAGIRTTYLRQYFHYIHPGATRIGVTTSDGRVQPVAFENADGTIVVVMNAPRGGEFTVAKLPAGVYGTSFTVDGRAGETLPDVSVGTGATLTATLPASGVITIYGKKP